MPRKRVPAAEPTAAPVQPHIIYPTAVYSAEEARRALRLRESTIRREVREGRLRVARRAGRHFILGSWLLRWLRTAPGARATHHALGPDDAGPPS